MDPASEWVGRLSDHRRWYPGFHRAHMRLGCRPLRGHRLHFPRHGVQLHTPFRWQPGLPEPQYRPLRTLSTAATDLHRPLPSDGDLSRDCRAWRAAPNA
jgi:hypothetical protein